MSHKFAEWGGGEKGGAGTSSRELCKKKKKFGKEKN